MNTLFAPRFVTFTALWTAGSLLTMQPALASEGKDCNVRYRITDLGTLGGGYAEAVSINVAGQVAGYSETADGKTHAFLWTRQGGMQDLGTLGGTSSLAYAINDRGEVVGDSTTAAGDDHAFIWSRKGGMRDLGLPGLRSLAFGINVLGQVAGSGRTATGELHALLWTRPGGMQDLGTLGGTRSFGSGLNDRGQVVGDSSTAAGDDHAFLWTRQGRMQDLGTLAGDQESSATSINEGGQVVGVSSSSDQQHAILWTNRSMEDLADSPDYAVAQSINNREQVTINLGFSPYVWSRRCGLQKQESSDPRYSGGGYGINDRGQLAGTACLTDPPYTCGAAVLTPMYGKSASVADH